MSDKLQFVEHRRIDALRKSNDKLKEVPFSWMIVVLALGLAR